MKYIIDEEDLLDFLISSYKFKALKSSGVDNIKWYSEALWDYAIEECDNPDLPELMNLDDVYYDMAQRDLNDYRIKHVYREIDPDDYYGLKII